LKFLTEFRTNLAIRLICALWFISLIMIGGAGRPLGNAGIAVWDVLVPPDRIAALTQAPPEPAPLDASPKVKPASLLAPRRMPVGPTEQTWTAPRPDPLDQMDRTQAVGSAPN
jgi:hypothetical protein